MTDEINKLNEKIKSYGDTIKKLHSINETMKQKNLDELSLLKEQLFKKDEECKGYMEKIKSMERKNEEIYKNVTYGNISDINDIKKQFDKDKMILNELIKTYKADLEEKSSIILKMQDEIKTLYIDIDEERKKNENLMMITNSKYDSKSPEIQYYKILTENSSLKSKLINSDEKNEKLMERLEKLRNEKFDQENSFKITLDLMKKEINFKNESYNKLLDDYQNTNQIVYNSSEDLEKSLFINDRVTKENLSLEKKVDKLENELIEIKCENQGLLTRLKGNESEIEINRKKLKEYESKIAEYKLSKQVFDVTYIYLRMSIEGRITFQKEGDQYSIYLTNRTATRKFSFLDVDINKDTHENNKLTLKFIKDNTQEEYFCNEITKLLDYYEEYKKKAIETTDFSSTKKFTNSEKKKNNVEKQLKDIFDI